ncbi:MAG: DUF2971 domain-containing protein [Cyclobacteriaceae bacterium]|nr:DUF2971 domain-containing protein [Cyclobacteriaceae bacterium]
MVAKGNIYKFFGINQYLYDILISNQLYFASIKQFNDPYDCHLTFPAQITLKDFKVYVNSFIKAEDIRSKYIKAFKKNPEKFFSPFKGLFKEFLDYHGICSFSKIKENLLLWSHYADSHKGVCLAFDYNLITEQFKQFDDVEYNDDPFLFDIKDANNSISKTVLRKSKDWEYEKEIRFVMERSKSAAFNMNALREINFGSRCSKRNMLNIIYLIKKLGYRKCKFLKAEINNTNYSVLFEEIDFENLKKEVLEDSKEKRFKQNFDLSHLL